MRTRDPMTPRLYRENRHVESSLSRDVRDIVGVGVLGLLLWVIAVLLFTTEGP